MVSGIVLDIDLDTGSQEESTGNFKKKNPFRIKRERILPKGT